MQLKMRVEADATRVRAFLTALGQAAEEETTLYLTGGATAVIEGWRETTLDIDLLLEPDSEALLRKIVELKEELQTNVELTSPVGFIPEPEGWRDRSPFVSREGRLTVRHFDLYSQALAKLERGFETDLADVDAMVAAGLVEPDRALEIYAGIEDQLFRFPAIDPARLSAHIRERFGQSALG